jgi:hypothetical protein
MTELSKRTLHYKRAFGIPYVPTISTGFDSSPRTLPSDGWPSSLAELRVFGCECLRTHSQDSAPECTELRSIAPQHTARYSKQYTTQLTACHTYLLRASAVGLTRSLDQDLHV